MILQQCIEHDHFFYMLSGEMHLFLHALAEDLREDMMAEVEYAWTICPAKVSFDKTNGQKLASVQLLFPALMVLSIRENNSAPP